jgi:predicted nucleic acid-binding protein
MPAEVSVDGVLPSRAVEVCGADRLDFSEAHVVACTETTGVGNIASFDTRNDWVGTVEKIEPRGT